MGEVTIDSIQIEIESNSANASKGLDALAGSLEKLKKNGCPEGEDLLTWFGKLVSAEIVSDALRIDDNEGNN